jgi:UDP-2,4-diacetamido-2,4,6-trideoxy-beta-L-altropyranose hydrolase
MRTLACAEEATAREISVEYVMAREPHTNAIPADHGYQCRVIDHSDGQSWIESVAFGDVVLFDGYQFGIADFQAARESGATVAVIDDLGHGEFPVDVVLNQNLGRATHYETRPDTRILIGPRYAMVRSEFRAKRRQRGNKADTLAISFGGSDVANLSRRTLEIALDSPFPRILLLVGPAADTDISGLPEEARQVDIITHPASVAAVFDRADAAVSAAGSTAWELLCMGMPTVFVEVAENQAGIGESIASIGAGLFAGQSGDLIRTLAPALEQLSRVQSSRQISNRGLKTVDGLGARRLVDTFVGRAS